jgi:hypothetical protein
VAINGCNWIFHWAGKADGGWASEHACDKRVEFFGRPFMQWMRLCLVPKSTTIEEIYWVTLAVGVSLALR